ncbi:MAG: ferritin-like domain-containing protein [SAR324 cluster bacterium]|nr:ferritin-like domain-containing protein [SAR324 cluster bacterium]
MESNEFVKELEDSNNTLLSQLKQQPSLEEHESLNIRQLLKIALKNEMEATELAAYWVHSTPEVDVKLGFSRQVGDEARHYHLIADRLHEMGEDLSAFDPLAAGYSPLFNYLKTLDHTVERVAAGQFTREAIALIKNEQFIELCRQQGDAKTAHLYEEIIQPDETYHQRLGKEVLEKYAKTEELQNQARQAAQKTLELAEELQQMAFRKMGVHHTPGC